MSGTSVPPTWERARAYLRRLEPKFFELEPDGSLALELDSDGWVLEVTPDGRLVCQAGVDMEDVQSLLSDGTPEGLGTDELAKQAKYYLQPAVSKFRKTLISAGFEENTEMNDQYVAVTFQRTVDLSNLEEVKQAVQWCRQQIRS